MNNNTGIFTGQNNLELFYRVYEPEGNITAIIIPVHGLCEHSGRYMNLVNYFVPRGYALYIPDQRGHGQSAGKRSYVERFEYYSRDLKTFVDLVRTEKPSRKIFLVGHSIGGLVAVSYALEHQSEFDGLILSGATIRPGASVTKTQIFLAHLLAFLAPKFGVDKIDASAISRDKRVIEAYENDSLVYRGKISAKMGMELLKAMQKLRKNMAEISLPVLIMSGTMDSLSDPQSSRDLFDGISSEDKTLNFYEGYYHEIFNEPGREGVFVDMEYWLSVHL